MGRRSCFVLLIGAITLGTLVCTIYALTILPGNRRNDKLLSGDYDTDISTELAERTGPLLEAIISYYRDQGQYPEDLDSLGSYYVDDFPASYMRGRLIYHPESYYGAPFFFGF